MIATERLFYKKFNILKKISDYIDLLDSSKIVNLKIPTEVYYRTELMCKCISSDMDIKWDVVHFIYYVYESFIKDAVEKYEPKKIVKVFASYPKYFQRTIFKVDGEEFTHSKFDNKMSDIIIKMDKEEIKKGELILCEIKELFGYNISFDELLSYLWIDYIEEYKKGNNKKAYKTLYKLIKDLR